jgi:hypothetical protein
VGPALDAVAVQELSAAPEVSAPQVSVVTVKAPARAPAPREALMERAAAQAKGLLATNTCSQVLVVYSEGGAHLYFDGPCPKGGSKTG